MDIDEYLWRTKKSRTDFAKEIGISRSHLSLILSGNRKPSTKLAKQIEQYTGGVVKKEELLFPEEYKETGNGTNIA